MYYIRKMIYNIRPRCRIRSTSFSSLLTNGPNKLEYFQHFQLYVMYHSSVEDTVPGVNPKSGA